MKINWKVWLGRLALLATLCSASGAITPLIPVRYRAEIVQIAAVVLAICPSVLKASGVIRPEETPIPLQSATAPEDNTP